MRIVSLVPSLTDAVAHLGAADQLIGVTRYCTAGAPDDVERLGGTKNPDVQRIIALRPDVVLANTEENRAEDLDRLRGAGLVVEEHYPRAVADVAPMLRRLGEVVGRPSQGEQAAADLEAARAAVAWPVGVPRVAALVLVWRKPWMAAGPRTYVSDLLETCGFANVLSGAEDAYPRLDPALALGPDVVLLPSEPYEFGPDDLPAVAELVGDDVPTRFVDGQALTWHGPRTAAALRTFGELAREVAAQLA